MYDVDAVRRDFPILSREVHGRPLVYLDNGASAQKPQAVIDAVAQVYGSEYANVHRGLHFLSSLATEKFEAVRGKLQGFLGAAHEDEIIFTTGSTVLSVKRTFYFTNTPFPQQCIVRSRSRYLHT